MPDASLTSRLPGSTSFASATMTSSPISKVSSKAFARRLPQAPPLPNAVGERLLLCLRVVGTDLLNEIRKEHARKALMGRLHGIGDIDIERRLGLLRLPDDLSLGPRAAGALLGRAAHAQLLVLGRPLDPIVAL